MKQLLKMIITLSSIFTFNIYADNQACLVKALTIHQNIEEVSRFANYELMVMNNYHQKTTPLLTSTYHLAKEKRLIDNNFYSLIQKNYDSFSYELKSHIDQLNFLLSRANLSSDTVDFNNCPNQEARVKCSSTLNNLASQYSEYIKTIDVVIVDHKRYVTKQTAIYQSLTNYYQSQVSPDADTISELHSDLENESYMNNQKMKRVTAITKNIEDLTRVDLLPCLLNQ